MVFGTLITKAGEKLYENRKKQKELAQTDEDVQDQLELDGITLEAGESHIVNFRSSTKDVFRKFYPFKSINAYNGTSENLKFILNENDSLNLPVPSQGQNGDQVKTGIYSVEVKNVGKNAVTFTEQNQTVTVSGRPEGIGDGSLR